MWNDLFDPKTLAGQIRWFAFCFMIGYLIGAIMKGVLGL